MKTLIVALYPYQGQSLDAWHDHGAGMTYTAAKQAGCDVSFLDLKTLHSDNELQDALKGYDLVAFGLKSSYYSIAMKVIKAAKANGSKTLVGGYHATAAPDQLSENRDIDYVFYGESEITFPQFLKNPSAFKREIRGEKPLVLDNLPFMDRFCYSNQLEPVTGWWHSRTADRHKMISVMAARGCPFRCAFCQPLEKNHFGNKLRRRSVDSVIKELKWLKDLFHPDCVMIHDDTFLVQKKWLNEFIEKYPEINLPFWAAGRADGICEDPQLVRKLIKVGWELVSVGFESGSQRILDKMKKGTTVKQNLEAAKIVKDAGASLYANYMTALPWETRQDIQATFKMADQIKAEMPSWAYFTPYPGCELAKECESLNWSLIDRNSYDRCPSGEKVMNVDYNYVNSCLRKGLREDLPEHIVDIIVPVYGSEDYTINCFKSIKRCTRKDSYRLIWIDNGSDRKRIEKATEGMNCIKVFNKTNEGFVKAINKGISISNAKYVCLLNSDTVVSTGWLDKLISHLAGDEKLGIIGSMTMPSPKGVDGVDSHHNLSLYSNLLSKDAEDLSLEETNAFLGEHYLGRTTNISFVAFLCAVIKREVIEKVGSLDENFDMGLWDDNDYNLTVRKAGYKTKLAIDTCIFHKGRATFNRVADEEGLNVSSILRKNKAYLDKKWFGSDTIILSRAIFDRLEDKPEVGYLSQNRLNIMQKYFINSLKNQTNMDFTLYMIVGEENMEATEAIKSLNYGNLKVDFIYTDNLNEWRKYLAQTKNPRREITPGCPEMLARNSGHPASPIMIRLDSDDWVAPGWIAHIKHLAATSDISHFLINYQPIYQAEDGRLFNSKIQFSAGHVSPFMVLVQKCYPQLSPYAETHFTMGSKFSKVLTIPPGYCFSVIHGENRYNKLKEDDMFIDDSLNIKSEKPHPLARTIPITGINKNHWRNRQNVAMGR